MSVAVITGVGAITALGADAPSTWARILAGDTAVRSWPDLAAEGFPLSVACRIEDDRLTDPLHRGRDLAVIAAAEALRDAGVDPARDRVGVYVGTTMGESAVFEAAAHSGEFDLAEGGGGAFARTVAEHFAMTGPQRTFGTACAAGNYAIGAAQRAVAMGRVDVAVAGGVEPFSRIAMLGFARMRAMAPDGCRPFAPARRGMTLGEGAAFVVVESQAHAAARGATPLARIGGLGLAADAHHPTAPREDGSGMAAAMRAGLKAADVSPGDVGWVSAHGTGTPRSDTAEAAALREVFGPSVPPVSSAKGAVGHTLGAATAVEAVLAALALRDGVLPPNGGVAEADPELGLDVVVKARRRPDLAWVMSCGYAFGGLNSALLLGRP
jgi:3-oxoacyl-[acyl-carrier-protein] synthase II